MTVEFDMPWESMLQYEGSSERPEDFDEYWDRALAELEKIDSAPSLSLADFQVPIADCYDLYFQGVDRARVYAKLLVPKRIKEPAPAILSFHGYGGQSADWSHYMHFIAMGYVVAALDCRGQAGKSEEGASSYESEIEAGRLSRGISLHPDQLLFRNTFLDTVQLSQIIGQRPDVDASRIATTGGSQGGGLAIACACLNPSVKLCAPLYPFLSDYPRIWDLSLSQLDHHELTEFLLSEKGQSLGHAEILKKFAYLDIQFLAKRLRARTLMAIGLQDRVCPPSSQMATYNKMEAPKTLEVYPHHGHDTLPGHSDKILQFFQQYL